MFSFLNLYIKSQEDLYQEEQTKTHLELESLQRNEQSIQVLKTILKTQILLYNMYIQTPHQRTGDQMSVSQTPGL